jgi:hypothetical protein
VSEYAPSALLALAKMVTGSGGIASAQLSGIIGDRSHTYGYHRGRNYVSSNDYSAVLSKDRKGDGEAASALDISYGPADQKLVTSRLMKAMKAKDKRVYPYIREFFGTLNGTSVTGWDSNSNSYTSSDDSHLWHVHLSFYREYANTLSIMRGIADVILGIDAGEEDDDVRIRSSYGLKKDVALKEGETYTIAWDTEYTDPEGAHANGSYPGYISPVSSYVDADLAVTIKGLRPGDMYQTRMVAHDWKAGKGSTSSSSEVLEDSAATTGNQFRRAQGSKYLTKGQHLYFDVTVWAGPNNGPLPTGKDAPTITSATIRLAQDPK